MEPTSAGGAPVAVVTGAGAGIGRATCLGLARMGYVVVASDRDEVGVGETVALASGLGPDATGIVADVTDAAAVRSLFERAFNLHGRLDVAVNNAGIAPPKGVFTELTEDQWGDVIGINLTGVWRCMMAEIPLMLRGGGGCIVNLSSRTGLSGSAGRAAYSASKHGVIGLTRSAALEYGASGLRINSVCPGSTRTAIIENAVPEAPDKMARLAAGSAMNRIGEPEEIAAAITWLCSPAASFVNGIELPVDGGVTRGQMPDMNHST